MRNLFGALVLGAVLAALGLSQAQARPRDEVMSGAYRCAAIGDSRTWLDCFYGAAQPVRAALGMRPAPPEQVALVAAPPAGAARDLAVRDAVMAGVFSCGAQAEDRAWLSCYYAAAQPMRVTLGLAQPAAPRPAPARAVPPADAFGLPAPPPRPIPADAQQVTAPMAEYSLNKAGYFTVTLANGEVWRQVDGDTSFAHWKKPAAAYLVRVTHGFLGSFNLEVKGLPGRYKVLRVR